jgi:hypothetical protein
MRTGFRWVLSVVAIAAIALHTALWGGTVIRASAAVDPFSVICHSGEYAGGGPTSPVPAPSHPCDHCNLCGSTSPPAAPPTIATFQLVPDRPPHVIEPISTPTRGGFEATLKGARGPPAFA